MITCNYANGVQVAERRPPIEDAEHDLDTVAVHDVMACHHFQGDEANCYHEKVVWGFH